MSKNIILQLHKTRKQTNNCEALFKSTREKIPMEKYRFICTFYKRKLVSDTSINYKGTKQKEGDTMWGAAVWNVRKHPGMRITKKKNKLHATKTFSAVKSNTQSCQREEKLKQNNKTFFTNLEGMHGTKCVFEWLQRCDWLIAVAVSRAVVHFGAFRRRSLLSAGSRRLLGAISFHHLLCETFLLWRHIIDDFYTKFVTFCLVIIIKTDKTVAV